MSENTLTDKQYTKLYRLILESWIAQCRYSEVVRTEKDPNTSEKAASEFGETQRILLQYIHDHLYKGLPE